MPISDTGKNILGDAVIRLIAEVWKNQIYDIVNEAFVSKLTNKNLAIRILSQIIEASHDVLLEGVTQRRIAPGSSTEVEMTDELVAAETKEWLKGLCLKIGYNETPNSPHYYLHGNLYNFGIRLREICQAKPEALLSADVQWQVERFGALPQRAEVLDFLKPQLVRINDALGYLATQKNAMDTMQYINDVLTEVFYPDLGDNRLPELILTIIGQHSEPKKKEEELEKCIRTFHMGMDDEAGAKKLAALKELYLRLEDINTQLGKKGIGVKELNEATEDSNLLRKMMKVNHETAMQTARAAGKKGAELLHEVNRLMLIPVDPFPQQEPQLSTELAKAFKIDMTGFANIGTERETSEVIERFQHLKIAKMSYGAATTMSNSPTLLTYKDSDTASIAMLADKLIFREAFLSKVLADETAKSKKTDKEK